MEVNPGEIIHMDENGAVKFPKDKLDKVLELSEYLQQLESKRQKRMRETSDVEELIRIMQGIYD